MEVNQWYWSPAMFRISYWVYQPIRSQCSLSLTPENIRKPWGFLLFSGVEKRCIGNEWVKWSGFVACFANNIEFSPIFLDNGVLWWGIIFVKFWERLEYLNLRILQTVMFVGNLDSKITTSWYVSLGVVNIQKYLKELIIQVTINVS